MEIRTVDIELIKSNPYRDFSLKPYDPHHIKNLAQIINMDGFNGALPARAVNNHYEIAYGHSRLEALKEIGIAQVSLDIQEFSDVDMLSMLVNENASQGNNFLATLDGTQAALKKIIYKFINEREKLPTRLVNAIQTGKGIGHISVTKEHKALKEKEVKIAISILRACNIYKSVFPAELQNLYDTPAITDIEAVVLLARPDHIEAWLNGVKKYELFKIIPADKHKETVIEMLKFFGEKITTSKITSYIKELAGIEAPEVEPEVNTAEGRARAIHTLESIHKNLEQYFNDYKIIPTQEVLNKALETSPYLSKHQLYFFAITQSLLETFLQSNNFESEEQAPEEIEAPYKALPEKIEEIQDAEVIAETAPEVIAEITPETTTHCVVEQAEIIEEEKAPESETTPKRKKQAPEVIESIKTDMRAGMSNQEICKKYNISSANACGYRKRL